MTYDGHLFAVALQRPANFEDLSAESQWAIDKQLGILDWTGACPHAEIMCEKCKVIWNARFKPEKTS